MTGESMRCARCGADFTRQVVDGDFQGTCPGCLAGLMASEPAAPAGARFQKGDVLQGYEILETLGQGGMGVVYKARQASLGRTVALKILSPQLAAAPEFVQRFEREAKGLASLNHPHVVHVYDFGRGTDLVAGDFLYLAMEFVDGQTLEESMKGKPVELPAFLRRMRDVARGLEAVHGAGLVHRDVKPANILVARDGTAKISDFGLAVDTEDAQKLTQTGMLLGTPHYVSPEHAQGKKVDGRSDLYALGVILFEGAAGRPPFQAPSATALLLKHVNEPPPPLHKLAPQSPKALQELVRRLLAKNPASRLENAAAVGRELEKVQAELQAGPVRNPQRVLSTPPAPAPRKLPLKWIGLGAAALLVLIVAVALFSGDPRPAAPKAPVPASSSRDARDALVAARKEAVKAPEPVRTPELEPPKPVPAVVPVPVPDSPQPPPPQEPPKPENPLDAVWKTAEQRFAEARARYEEGRTKEAADILSDAAFKAEDALAKYRALTEVGDADVQKRASEQAKAVQQFMKLVNETRLAMSKPVKPVVPDAPVPVPVPPTPVPPPIPLARGPVPEAASLKDLEKQIRDIYKKEYALKAPADQAAFARTLLEQAATERDRKLQYLLLREARDLAAAAGDAAGALEAVEAMDGAFEMELLPAKQAVLAKLPAPKSAEAAAALGSAYETLAREAVAADQYELAAQAAAKAEAPSKAAQDAAAVARIAELKKEVAFLKEEYPRAKAAIEKPGTGDAEAAGRFLCFCKGDWGRGLPLLATLKTPLGELAGKDLAGPADAEARVVVADGWWDLAEKERHPIRKQRLQERARQHYAEALGTLGGLPRLRVEKRLEGARPAGPAGSVDLLALIDPAKDTVNGRWTLAQGRLDCEPEWFGRILVPYLPPDEYDWQITVERRLNDEDFYLGVVKGEAAVGISVDAGHSSYTGFGDMTARGEAVGKFPGGVLPLHKPAVILVAVRKRSITLSVDGRRILQYSWKGDEARTMMPDKWEVPPRGQPFIGAHGSSFRVHKMLLATVSGSGRPVRGSPAPAVAPPAPIGAGVDLLALIDAAKDAVEGTWIRDGAALQSAAGEHVRLQVPYLPPDEYDLRVTLERGPSADGLAFGLARGSSQWTVFVDKLPSEGGQSGLEMLDGGQHTAARGLQVAAGQSATFDFKVRRSGLSVLKDGKPLFQWQGAYSRLSNFPRWEVPNKQALFLGHWQSAVKYTELRLVPVSGTGRPLRIAAPAYKPPPIPKNAVDLLALVDPAKDAVKGDWTKDAEGLRCPGGDHIRLMIPYVPPDEYDVHYDVERVQGVDGLLLGLSRGNFQWAATLDSQPGAGYKAGLESLDGGGPATVTGPLFQNGVVARVEAKVRKSGVTVTVDGRPAIDFKGATSRLSLPDGWKVGNPKAMFLAAWGTSYRFRKIALVPVSGAGTVLRR